MKNWNVISSGSKGNCVIYRNTVMVDIGIKLKDFKLIEPYMDDVKIICVTHRHTDHLQIPLMKKIIKDYPDVVWAYGSFVREHLDEKLITKVRGKEEYESIPVPREILISPIKPLRAKNIGLLIQPVALYHDVPNFGFYIKFMDDELDKGYYDIFHATDTYHLNKIKIPKDIDLVAIEHHHIQEHYDRLIEQKIKDEVFSHEIGASNSHLSFEEATEFLRSQIEWTCDVLRLHLSSDEYYKDTKIHYRFVSDKYVREYME